MNLVHTFEFTVISILYLFTIIQTMSLIYGTKEYRRKYVTVFLRLCEKISVNSKTVIKVIY